jgi:N-acetyl-alpha-D-muramate 1-phosphate uridylyltransferase
MGDSVAGVVLAAGGGTRLRPLTHERPKALCPVGGVALVDRALAALSEITPAVAVNAHHGADQLVAHVGDRAFVSVEPVLAGTGGALARLRPWLADRAVLVVNADAVHDADLAHLTSGWDGERLRFLVAGPAGSGFGPGARLCGALMPAAAVAALPNGTSSIYDELWRPWAAAGRVEAVAHPGAWFDTGTVRAYLEANLWVSGGATVVGTGAEIHGEAVRCVLWEDVVVHPVERLVDTIRTTAGRTVLVR